MIAAAVAGTALCSSVAGTALCSSVAGTALCSSVAGTALCSSDAWHGSGAMVMVRAMSHPRPAQAHKPLPMTTDELRGLLDQLGWSQKDLARVLDRNISRTHFMCRGRLPIDDELAVWLRDVAEVWKRKPKPPGKTSYDPGYRIPETG